MKKILLLALLSLPILSNAQKIRHDSKTNQITVDGVYSFTVDRIDCTMGRDCHFDVFDTAGNKVIRVNHREYKSLLERKASNPEGRVIYYEFIFLTSKTKAEIDYLGIKEIRIAEQIVKDKLIVDGKLDEKAVEEFVLVHGTPHSNRSRN